MFTVFSLNRKKLHEVTYFCVFAAVSLASRIMLDPYKHKRVTREVTVILTAYKRVKCGQDGFLPYLVRNRIK